LGLRHPHRSHNAVEEQAVGQLLGRCHQVRETTCMRDFRGADRPATVTDTLGHFAVPVQPLPPYRPEPKGSTETLNRCTQMFFAHGIPTSPSQE
jgi:hypothetical protein